MNYDFRYFIVPILQSTSDGSSDVIMYHCRVVDFQYREIFNETFNNEDKEIFIKIMKLDKEALLYRTNERLSKICNIKIDHLQNKNIVDGTI